MRIVLRLAGTTVVVLLLLNPSGIVREFTGRPPAASAAVVAAFLVLVALYCRTLQRALALVEPGARTARPGSVWWMFAVPFNFVEDFFIVRAITASLAAEAVLPARRIHLWALLGYGWCAFQIVSLLPGPTGWAGGAVAGALWAAHWVLTAHLNRRRAR